MVSPELKSQQFPSHHFAETQVVFLKPLLFCTCRQGKEIHFSIRPKDSAAQGVLKRWCNNMFLATCPGFTTRLAWRLWTCESQHERNNQLVDTVDILAL